MPLTRRSAAQIDPVESTLSPNDRDRVIEAAVNAPARKRRGPRASAPPRPILTSWEAAPQHIRDNEFILWGYRTGYNFKSSLTSMFSIHNETGNIWTHLIGFVIFICLTVAIIYHRPAPLRLGQEALTALESRLASLGDTRASLYDLLASAGAWERSVLKYGADRLNVLEDKLRSIHSHNLTEITALADSLAASIRRYGASGMAELASLEHRLESRIGSIAQDLSSFSSEAINDIENALHRALASVLSSDHAMVKWPVSRWPMYVFTAGAMICLLTSSVCHVFGCCAAHIASVMWRFDYAGIAVLIVASFFPPVYYGFLCKPALRITYLIITSILGASTLGITLLERFQHPTWHPYRAALFVGLGLWGVVPMTHGLLINSGADAVMRAMQLDILMGAIYIGGAVLYATKIPERWKPGAFDVAFHSHQLFHVAVVVAAIVHYKASQGLMEWRDTTGGCFATTLYSL